MAHATPTARDLALPAFPSLRAAASMVGVNPSSLQRRSDLAPIACGRERRLDPATVLRLTAHYGNRSVMEAAHDLVAHATEHSPEHLERVEEIVDEFLRTYDAAHPPKQAALSVDQVLEELAPYIRPTDRTKAERALRAAASR